MDILCAHCQQQLSVDDAFMGQNVQCPYCAGTMTVPVMATTAQPFAFAAASSGSSKTVYVQTDQKNSGIAAVLSFFFPGAGQIYNGQIGKGLLFLILHFVFAVACLILIGF